MDLFATKMKFETSLCQGLTFLILFSMGLEKEAQDCPSSYSPLLHHQRVQVHHFYHYLNFWKTIWSLF
ncbi:hypothetical protein Lalb_Chr16g0386571 [Lupinus albus]|uniref:Uncharacterized protein n=1 Tax=Lupinus albus TaxID=3870 RepID=A0A6A4P778_LUPAL|nr:hypothetical protein Lalb_Chr16g0386571 [Lupinus albus]